MEDLAQWDQIYNSNTLVTAFFPPHNSSIFENGETSVNSFNLFNQCSVEKKEDKQQYQNVIQEQYSHFSIEFQSQSQDMSKLYKKDDRDNVQQSKNNKNRDMIPKNEISKMIMNKYNKTLISGYESKNLGEKEEIQPKKKLNIPNIKQVQSKINIPPNKKEEKPNQQHHQITNKKKSVTDLSNLVSKNNNIKFQDFKKFMIYRKDNEFETESIKSLKKPKKFNDDEKRLYSSKVEKGSQELEQQFLQKKNTNNRLGNHQAVKIGDIFKKKSNDPKQQLQNQRKTIAGFPNDQKKQKLKVDFKNIPVLYPRQTINFGNDNSKYMISKRKNAPKILEKSKQERLYKKPIQLECYNNAVSNKADILIKNHNRQFDCFEAMVQKIVKQTQNLRIRMKQQNTYFNKIHLQTEILKTKIQQLSNSLTL